LTAFNSPEAVHHLRTTGFPALSEAGNCECETLSILRDALIALLRVGGRQGVLCRDVNRPSIKGMQGTARRGHQPADLGITGICIWGCPAQGDLLPSARKPSVASLAALSAALSAAQE